MFNTCDHCDNPATTNIAKIVNGKVVHESFFCEDCKPADTPGPGMSPLKEMAKLLKQAVPGEGGSVVRRGAEARAVCPECGMTFAEFRQGGRLGCSHDYQAFGEAMASLLASIHKADTYTGKTPGGQGEVDHGRVIDDLSRARDRLERLVHEERYEEAARLRDEIQQLESSASPPAVDRSGGPPASDGGGPRRSAGRSEHRGETSTDDADDEDPTS